MWRKTTCRWSSVGDVFNPISMTKKPKKRNRSKKKQDAQEKTVSVSDPPNSNMLCPTLAPDVTENERTEHSCSVAGSTDAVAKNFVEAEGVQTKHACVFTDAEAIFQIAPTTIFTVKSEEEVAAIRIQTAIRGYLARREWQSLGGPIRLKSNVSGPSVRRQTSNALKYMDTQSHAQFQIRSRRIKMSLEKQAIQSHLLHSKQLKDLKVGDGWDASLLSKDQIKTNLFEKYEATMRRERSLAYLYVHQKPWNKPAKSTNLWSVGPNNPHVGWMWFDRWMTSITTPRIPVRETTKCLACRLLNPDNPSTPSPQKSQSNLSSLTPCSKSASTLSAGKENSTSTSNTGNNLKNRHSRIMTPHSVPNYMAPTLSAKAKLKQPMESGKVHNSI